MIISSVILWNLPQADGSSNVREEHVDDQGNVFNFDYSAPSGFDVDSRLSSRADELNAQEADSGSSS